MGQLNLSFSIRDSLKYARPHYYIFHLVYWKVVSLSRSQKPRARVSKRHRCRNGVSGRGLPVTYRRGSAAPRSSQRSKVRRSKRQGTAAVSLLQRGVVRRVELSLLRCRLFVEEEKQNLQERVNSASTSSVCLPPPSHSHFMQQTVKSNCRDAH